MSIEEEARIAFEATKASMTYKERQEMEKAERKLNRSLNRVLNLPKETKHLWRLVPYVEGNRPDWGRMLRALNDQIALTTYEEMLFGVIRTREFMTLTHPKTDIYFYYFDKEPVSLGEDQLPSASISNNETLLRHKFVEVNKGRGFDDLSDLGAILESRRK